MSEAPSKNYSSIHLSVRYKLRWAQILPLSTYKIWVVGIQVYVKQEEEGLTNQASEVDCKTYQVISKSQNLKWGGGGGRRLILLIVKIQKLD